MCLSLLCLSAYLIVPLCSSLCHISSVSS